MITVLQRPLPLTPSNVEHIYNFSSPNTGNTDFRYVVDIYVDTTTSNPTKVSRMLVSPNTYGVGIINVDKIIQNYVQGNAMSDNSQWTSVSTTGTTAYGLVSNTNGPFNQNSYIGNSKYPQRYHVRDYRVMVGEQWSLSGGTIINISDQSQEPGSSFYAELVGSTIYWYGAGSGIVEGSSYEKGVTWVGSASGETSTEDGSVALSTAFPIPASGNTIVVEEKYSGIQWVFTYDGEEWVDSGQNNPSEYDPSLSPPAVYIWPGTSLDEGSYISSVYNNPYWDSTSPENSHQFWEVKKYRMSGTTVNDEEPSLFLTTAGPQHFYVNDNNIGSTTSRARRRRHHPDCPIIVSWFNGQISTDTEFQFDNDLGCFTMVTSADQTSYDAASISEYSIDGNTFTGRTPTNKSIKSFMTYPLNTTTSTRNPGGKIAFWTAGDVGDYEYDGYAYSELLEFYIEEDDCLSDPVHVLFLNRQGVWDTWTLDRKSVETKSILRKTYEQGGIRNLSVYSQLSSERRQVIFDQDIVETMNVSTWYLEDNDLQIVEDLFMSPEVYIMKDHKLGTEKEYNPYLLPVTLRTDMIEEFKNRYNKITQYRFVLEYTPINDYNTQG